MVRDADGPAPGLPTDPRDGPAVLPLLLRELQERPDHWFWALRAITGEDPVATEDRGKLDAMTAAWLRWAEKHAYSISRG